MLSEIEAFKKIIMKNHKVSILSITNITHNVIQIITTKPEIYNFLPGQSTDISINKPKWKSKRRSFTITNLPEDNYLEFIIKTYPMLKGVTRELLNLEKGDELIIHDVFGNISYKGEGTFIAGGCGITPFISIFKSLHSKNLIGNNKLIFANKTKDDIILEHELKKLLGNNFINILSKEKIDGYEYGQITEDFIEKNSFGNDGVFYLCGPFKMMKSIESQLRNLNVTKQNIIKEEFTV